jgi:CheY-like chemotaxis protein
MDREMRSLLVVDSSASHIFFMGTMLRKLDYKVRSAMNADDALRAMNDALPALVLTDTALPAKSGIMMLKEMRQSPQLRAVPVIVHSSETDSSVREACLSAGATDFYRKPTDFNVLYSAIQAATESVPRKSIRIDTLLKAAVKNGTGATRQEQVTALSEGGCYVCSNAPEPVHTVLSLTLFFKNREVTVSAVVQYSSTMIGGQHKEPGMGMKFMSIRPEDRIFVRDFIKDQIARDIPV